MAGIDEMTRFVCELIRWALSGGIAGVATFVIMERIKFGPGWTREYKKYLALGIGFVGSAALFAFATALLPSFFVAPDTWQAWVIVLLYHGAVGLGAGQVAHAISLKGQTPRAR